MERQQQRAAVRAAIAASARELGEVADERRSYAEFATNWPPTPGMGAEEVTLGGRPAVRVRGEDATPSRTVLLYLHGGGYVIGSGRTGARLAAELVRRTGGTGYSLDYRLAPEHPFPAAVDDALAAYRELLASTDAGNIVVAGDSAGGGLAVTMLIAARAEGLPQPAAVAMFSPWTDLTLSGESVRTKAGIDPLFTEEKLRWYVVKYTPDGDARVASPIFADLTGLPPMIVQVGEAELLLDDAVRLAGRAASDGIDVTLEVGSGLTHVYQHSAGQLDDADQALDRAAAFLRARLPVESATPA